MVEHVVLFAFKPGTGAAEVVALLAAQFDLAHSIPGVVGAAVGEDFSGRAAPFTHCGRFVFRNRASLEAFYPHPAHQAFRERLAPALNHLLVLDFEPAACTGQ